MVYEGESIDWEPDPLTLRVLANELIETLDNSSDAARLLDGVEPREAEALYSTLPSGFREDLARTFVHVSW